MKPFAFVFPGQGSQSVGMLDGWGAHPLVQEVVKEASEALGEDIGLLIKDGPKEALALTTNTQPVMLVAGVAAYRVWMAEVGIAPQALAGHSGTELRGAGDQRQRVRRSGRGVWAARSGRAGRDHQEWLVVDL